MALKPAATAASPGDNAMAAAAGEALSDGEEAQRLHLIVGRSLFLNFPERLRRVYVSNPVVLDSIASSPFELVITARAAGTSSLVLWSTGGQTQMYTVLADVDVAGLRESLADALPGDHVEGEAQQGRVHLSGVVGSDAAADEALSTLGAQLTWRERK